MFYWKLVVDVHVQRLLETHMHYICTNHRIVATRIDILHA